MATKKRRRKEGRHSAPRAAEGASSSVEGATALAPPPAHRFRVALLLLAAAYLVTVWLDGIGSNLPARLTPRVWLYFSQVAALFKNAGMMAIDYRAEGWSCESRRWIEVDVRPFFRIDADNKENRFHRALQFYRKERKVMRALEDYVIKNHNATPGRPPIVGVRFRSLRVPYPKIGDHVGGVERKPLEAYPEEMRHAWYWTPGSKRRALCKDSAPAPKDDDDRGTAEPHGKDPEP